MLVGEQPGDQEDLQGRPFVGPAGRILDKALAEAGIDRDETYVTNAVKHFKWEPRGKRRIHKKPNSIEIAACKPWLEAELSVLKPDVLVFGLKSHVFGIGTVVVAISPKVSELGDISGELKYAKIGVFPIPRDHALQALEKATRNTKLEGLFAGKEIDPADLYAFFIVIRIKAIEIDDGEMTIKGRMK